MPKVPSTTKEKDAFNNFMKEKNPQKYFYDTNPAKLPYWLWHNAWQGLLPGVGLHYSMFWLSLKYLSSPEQLKKWMPLA